MFQIILFLFFLISIFSFFSIAPWVPTRKRDVNRVTDIIKISPGETFLEIGCGTARVTLAVAAKHQHTHCYGIELSPFFYLISLLKAKLGGYQNVTILYGNALKIDFSKYDVMYIFGMPDVLRKKFIPKLQKEMKKDTRFYSYTFKIDHDDFLQKKFKEKNLASIYEYTKK